MVARPLRHGNSPPVTLCSTTCFSRPALPGGAALYCIGLDQTAQHPATLHHTAQHPTTLHHTAHCSSPCCTLKHYTAQHHTAQHYTAQHYTANCIAQHQNYAAPHCTMHNTIWCKGRIFYFPRLPCRRLKWNHHLLKRHKLETLLPL